MRAYVYQVVVDAREPAAERLERVLATLAGLDAPDLVVLPELWLHGAFDYHAWGPGIDPDDPVLHSLASAAATGGFFLHAGSVVLRGDGDSPPTNTTLVFGPDGSTAARYDKIHLFGFDQGEAVSFRPGSQAVTMPVQDATIGLAICFDLRFPELFRQLGEAGSDVLAVPSAWPDARTDHWRVLLQARAIESQSFVLGAATAGTHAGLTMSGYSAIVAPDGDVLAEADAGDEAVLFADLDLNSVKKLRESFPVLKQRRLM